MRRDEMRSSDARRRSIRESVCYLCGRRLEGSPINKDHTIPMLQAKALFKAVTDRRDGVMKWLTRRWNKAWRPTSRPDHQRRVSSRRRSRSATARHRPGSPRRLMVRRTRQRVGRCDYSCRTRCAKFASGGEPNLALETKPHGQNRPSARALVPLGTNSLACARSFVPHGLSGSAAARRARRERFRIPLGTNHHVQQA